MVKAGRKPELIVIAGPNGSGKTSVTQKFLHHEWADGTVYINPDQIANDKFGDWNSREAVLQAANYCAEWREQCESGLKEKVEVFTIGSPQQFYNKYKGFPSEKVHADGNQEPEYMLSRRKANEVYE